MVISIVSQKYACGCGRGQSEWKEKDVLKKLNGIIEWERCAFPFKLKENGDPKNAEDYIQDREFLGEKPELKPGDCFYWNKQLFGIDNLDSIILLISETGPLAGKRLLTQIKLENSFKNESENLSFTIEGVNEIPGDQALETITPDYNTINTMWDKFWRGRYEEPVLKFKITDENFIMEPVLYWNQKEFKFYYNPEEIFEKEEADYIINLLFATLYKNYDRMKYAETEVTNEPLPLNETE